MGPFAASSRSSSSSLYRKFVITIIILPTIVLAQTVTTVTSTLNKSNGQDQQPISCPSQCRCQGDDNLNVDCRGANMRRPPVTSVSTLTLDLSRNSMGPIINATFARMVNLTSLDLSYNGLTRLLGCTFNGMLSLKRVSLRGNRLTSLPDSLFTDSTAVEHVDLSRNIFVELPDHAFRNTPNLKSVDFSHNRLVDLRLGTRFQVPRHLQSIDLSYNLFETVEIDSFHIAEQWESGVKRRLKLNNCRLTVIQPGALAKIPDLNNLELSGNPGIPAENLTAVVKELERQRLERLSLSNMNLTSIQPLFTQVTHLALKFLNVSHNEIDSVPTGTFSTIRSLRVLDISHNKLTSLEKGFKDLINLVELNISSNALTEFKGNAVNGLDKVEVLDISDNRLSQSSKVKLRPLIKLKQLNVKTNLLSEVILPQTTNNLVDIDYSSNSIRQFSGFDHVPKLERFDISDNDLEKVEEFLFKQSHIMKVANFSRNSITEVDPRAFLPQAPLVIDLSHNFITRVQYSNWIATQELYLNHNRIEEVDMQSFHRMTGLRRLDLSENNLTRLHEDLMGHTTALEHLHISHNSLTDTDFTMVFRHLQDLKELDLSNNNISRFNESMLMPLTKLEKISVRENKLGVIMPRVFSDLRHLKMVDISDNPFSCVCDMLALKDWLSRTSIVIPGLYEANSTAFVCQSPASRTGDHVMKWEPDQFECDEVMLYMIVFGSIGVTLIVAGIVSTVVHRLYLRYHRMRENKLEEEKKKKQAQMSALIEIEELKRAHNKKMMMMADDEEINEDFRDAILKRERRSMRKAEKEERDREREKERKTNGYIAWPGSDKKRDGEKKKDKEGKSRKNDSSENEASSKKDRGNNRSPERQYDHLMRGDDGRMRLDGVRDGRRERHGEQGGRNRDRHDRPRGTGEYIDIAGGIGPNSHRRSGQADPEYDNHNQHSRGQRGDPDRMYRGSQTALPPGLPPRNRWDEVEVWDRGTGRWIIPGYKRSRSQGHRQDRNGQRYMTMPVREQDYYYQRRSRSSDPRGRGGKPTMYHDRYTNEVRYGVEDLHRYPSASGEHRSRRDLYESRSKSYHTLPHSAAANNLTGPNEDRGSSSRRPRVASRDMGYADHHYQHWDNEGQGRHHHPSIGQRAVSQPFLANENTSDWL